MRFFFSSRRAAEFTEGACAWEIYSFQSLLFSLSAISAPLRETLFSGEKFLFLSLMRLIFYLLRNIILCCLHIHESYGHKKDSESEENGGMSFYGT